MNWLTGEVVTLWALKPAWLCVSQHFLGSGSSLLHQSVGNRHDHLMTKNNLPRFPLQIKSTVHTDTSNSSLLRFELWDKIELIVVCLSPPPPEKWEAQPLTTTWSQYPTLMTPPPKTKWTPMTLNHNHCLSHIAAHFWSDLLALHGRCLYVPHPRSLSYYLYSCLEGTYSLVLRHLPPHDSR